MKFTMKKRTESNKRLKDSETEAKIFSKKVRFKVIWKIPSIGSMHALAWLQSHLDI